MTNAPKHDGPIFCGHCAYGTHKRCPWETCACAAQSHDPHAGLAARLFTYCRPDLRKLPEHERAAAWRTATGSGHRTEVAA
jgi:hypothetical protein